MKILVFLSFFYSFILISLGLSVEILDPIKDGQETALIIIPGAQIEGAAYKPLASVIQKRSPLKLWIVLCEGFLDNLANLFQVKEVVNMAISDLKKKGLKEEKIFIAGHSLGGAVLSSYAKSNYKRLQGVLLYAAYLKRGNALRDYPIPVLTLSGELDGLCRITRILETFEELGTDVAKDKNSIYRTPVIIMPGVNHAQFASGLMPSTVVAYDLVPDVSNATAYDAIANYTNAFISSTLLQSNDPKQELEMAYNSTHNIMKPLLSVKSFDVNPHQSSGLAVEAQYRVSDLVQIDKLKVKDIEVNEQSFVRSKPQADVKNDTLYVINYATVTYSPNPIDVSTEPQSPLEIQTKLKSKESLKVLFPNGTFTDKNVTCKDVNTLSFAYAMSSAAPFSVKRMQTRGIPNVTFHDDVEIPKEALWNLEPLELDYEADGMHVTSYSYTEPVDQHDKTKGGMYSCKLLSPYRAIEWIYVDSLRNYNLTKHFRF